jgi:flagellar biosynthesis/type III secretory pathway protein FliH
MGHLLQRFGRMVPAAVVDAGAEARALLDQARRQADALLAEAGAQADALRAQAQREGEAEGRARGEAAFTTTLVEARADAEQVRRAALPAAQTIAVRMAEKIVGRVIALDATAMADIARQALEATRARAGVVSLRVHPDDWAAIETARPALAALRVIPDAAVGRHGCVVESGAGRLDARLDTQLAALERAAFGGRVHD